MARKKQSYVKGPFTHRRTEADYMGVLLDAVTEALVLALRDAHLAMCAPKSQ